MRAGSPIARPVLALDRWLRRRQGIYEFSHGADCVFRIERGRAQEALHLADGTRVRPGEPVIKLHLWNEHIPPMGRDGPTLGWARRIGRLIEASLRELARHLEASPDLDDFRVICAEMRLGPAERGGQLLRILGRYGFEPAADTSAGRRGRLHRLGETVLMVLLVLATNPGALRWTVWRRDHQRILLSRALLERRCRDSAVSAAARPARRAHGPRRHGHA